MGKALVVRPIPVLVPGCVEGFAIDVLGMGRQVQADRVRQVAIMGVGHGYSNGSSFFQGCLPISGSVWKDSR